MQLDGVSWVACWWELLPRIPGSIEAGTLGSSGWTSLLGLGPRPLPGFSVIYTSLMAIRSLWPLDALWRSVGTQLIVWFVLPFPLEDSPYRAG